ncbi:MAG: hypothetical protein IAC23_09595 [Bacteroidetes bacterium]|uniref:Uncharacterized protein n=1 Tax=Candidatus Cryptobacteroides merdavium TaxID=2840769 RepID=A0A9D9HDN8_9BACT|nr:hypothetical protein [Candidatus Cryptobacteroides merdavium]
MAILQFFPKTADISFFLFNKMPPSGNLQPEKNPMLLKSIAFKINFECDKKEKFLQKREKSRCISPHIFEIHKLPGDFGAKAPRKPMIISE